MSRPRGLTRRTLLKGLGGLSLSLPLFGSLGCRSSSPAEERVGRASQADGFPKRFVFVYTPNGNIFLPPGSDFAGSILEPLTPFQSKMLVLRGLDLSAHNKPPGEPHQQGMALLTGRSLNPGNQVGGDGSLAGWASGMSVDQAIAEAVGVGTAHRSLQLGVQSTAYGGTEVRTVVSYAGADLPNANETNPYSLWNLVFSELGQDPVGAARTRAHRHSVLDAVGKQYEALSPKLSSEDRLKLEQHLTAVRDVESRLDSPGGVLGGYCQLPDAGPPIDLDDPANFAAIGRLQMDLLVMALACDLTRVGTLQWSASTNNRPYPFLQYDDGSGAGPQPILGDDHLLGHQPDEDVHAWGKLRVIRRFYMEQLAYLLAKLDSIQEGDGTMLDHSVVVLGSELSKSNQHSHMDVPFLLAGSAGGYFKTGRDLTYPAETPHNGLLVSLLNAMGVEATTFGDPAYCTGPLPDLTG